MIISHHHKFIFIKTRKTASTSVEMVLSAICRQGDVLTPLDVADEALRLQLTGKKGQNYRIPWSQQKPAQLLRSLKHFKQSSYTNHVSAKKVISIIGWSSWDNYFTFCFEREPRAKLISHYKWQKQKGLVDRPEDYIKKKAYLKIAAAGLYLDAKGNSLVDKVYKMEEMQVALKDIEDRLGLDRKLLGPGELRTKKSELITAKEREYLERAYHQDLHRFFKFETELYDGF